MSDDYAPHLKHRKRKPKIRPNRRKKRMTLKEILGEWYGGPILCVEDGKFVLCTWGDAPVSCDEICRGETINAIETNFHKSPKRDEWFTPEGKSRFKHDG